ncbi:uncharacterized protein PHACADRAFT_246417 [Phanerochaete carnosa HHB-10118-sp]|uniref:Uncharacterized protein n=1 Tax=Phanerochaete carnosa (strain HHB-10118-sp) TaxID=650164 RepID=K5WMN9_PHACS|nr:uncharacterized protein PHACADRAFT_246417 [Phanerochaete carnosa HHB-10118-sp]EKM60459.1 hypothetical protein PHACADRAFT_246417 [Phanerochaete carnosa HHB-10118-sp]
MVDTQEAHVRGINDAPQSVPTKGVRNFDIAKLECEIDAPDMHEWRPRILART